MEKKGIYWYIHNSESLAEETGLGEVTIWAAKSGQGVNPN